MKYIRTNEKVYEQGQIVITHELPLLDRKGDGKLYVNETLIIKQADTIEELCDTFVVWEGKKLITFITYTNVQMPRFIEMVKKHIFTIYGAIWTDKGLIYVAKMNNKGELELL